MPTNWTSSASVTAARTVDVGHLIDTLLREDHPDARPFLQPLGLVDDELLTGVYFMVEGVDVPARLLGLQCLATYYRSHGDVRLAAEIALGLISAFEQL